VPPSTPPPQLPPAGWYADPEGSGSRWWDGEGWTEYFQAPSGHSEEALTDPTADSTAIVPEKEAGIKTLFGVLGGIALFFGGIALIAVVVTLVFHPDPGAQEPTPNPASQSSTQGGYNHEYEEAHDLLCTSAEFRYTSECK
jgi:hypothetical protein